jgi:DNA N-6-adenine-methyltransferase (Dam)
MVIGEGRALHLDKKRGALEHSFPPVYCNPPYGKEISRWVKRAYEEARKGNVPIVMLIPARMDTQWMQSYVLGKTDKIVFLKGRIKFVGFKNSANFPSMLAIFDGSSNVGGAAAVVSIVTVVGSNERRRDFLKTRLIDEWMLLRNQEQQQEEPRHQKEKEQPARVVAATATGLERFFIFPFRPTSR